MVLQESQNATYVAVARGALDGRRLRRSIDGAYMDDTACSGIELSESRAQQLWESRLGAEVFLLARKIFQRSGRAWKFPHHAINLDECSVIADIGCGPGTVSSEIAARLRPGGIVVGIDRSEPMLRLAAVRSDCARVALVRASATALPLHDGQLDLVCSVATLQLVPDYRAAIAEMYRILRPGHCVVLMVPSVRKGPLGHLAYLMLRRSSHFFSELEVPASVRSEGFVNVVHWRSGPFQWITASKPVIDSQVAGGEHD